MSYRGTKPLPGGQGRRAEADTPASLTPGSMLAPTVDYGEVNSLGFPIAISRQADIQEGLGDIASRLNRALGQYENVFDDDDEVSKDADWTVDGQADGRRMGARDEKREFQARYETITARVDAMERERTELMNSMAQWLEAEPVQWIPTADTGAITDDTPQKDGSIRDQLLKTKMGFEQLKQMNHEKERLDNQGQDTGHLQEASSNLQMKVITKFKKLYETKKLAATRRSFGTHWKHASEEIVGLLRRIRSEGTDNIDALEEQLEKAMNAIQRQSEEMMRLEGQIREKEEMVEKWSKDNVKLTNDNLLLNSEKEKCRDMIKKLKKALIEERRKKGKPTTEEDVENIAEGKAIKKQTPDIQQQTQRGFRRVAAGRDVKRDNVLCQICRRRVESGMRPERAAQDPVRSAETREGLGEGRGEGANEAITEDLVALQEENDWLAARVAHLEQKLIEKETQMMKLEFQLSEMMEAIQTSSPHIIQTLSLTDPTSLSSLVRVTRDTSQTGSTRQTEGNPSTEDSDGQGFSQKPTSGKKTSNLVVPRVIKPSSKKTVKRRAGEQQPITQPPSQSNLAQPAEISLLTEERNKLQEELVQVKGQLMRAQRELITLKYASSAPPVSMGTGGPRQGRAGTGERSSQEVSADSDNNLSTTKMQAETTTAQEKQAQHRAKPVVKYDDEFEAYAELISKDQVSRPSRRMSRPYPSQTEGGKQQGPVARVGEQKGGHEKQVPLQMEDYITFDQGMQTDPQMDPLGQWSNVPSLKKRKTDHQPILDTPSDQVPIAQPPTEWTHFDPTGPITPATDNKRASISLQMRAGQKPASLDTGGIVEYVDRELGRIIQGINGFTSYLKRLIQREVTDMITTNQDIRRRLSEVTLQKLDQGVKDSTHPSAETSRRSRALATPIHRGRFEVIKDHKPSKFATKNAFASLQSGGRKFYHSASPIPPWNIYSKTPTPLPADYMNMSTFAHDHITMADEVAMERYLASPHDTICSRLQHQIDMIGQHAIDVLKGTTVFFKETVTRQMEEYNTLHGAFSIRQELKTLMAPSTTPTESKDGTMESGNGETQADVTSDHAQLLYQDPPLKLARSTSHNSFLESRNIKYVQEKKHIDFDFQKHPKVYPLGTQSLSSMQSSHCYLPALALYDKQTPRNRYEMKVPKATLPRRGLVTLQVKEAAVKMDAKGVDTKRRSRPVAISHRGLQSHQREILAKQGTAQDRGEQDEEPRTTTLELKRQILQLQANQLYQAADQSSLPTGDPDTDARKTLPLLENERRRVIIHAQDQLRDTVQRWDKYAGLLSDGRGPE
ncbi:uncharacterized protein LOC119724346 [Patiria miniata]|uniref:Uncharacterized protein n=1 Tax=Patiria miniata TaxID=46514 RepID=A0A913ZJN8_PATMI|nr:uncharacterized protein LOC119724346 [Patiria miniata]